MAEHHLRCRLCGREADRLQDHGSDGVAFFCGHHGAEEVEPLACEPISGKSVYLIDDEIYTTLSGFVEANTDPVDGLCNFDDWEIAVMCALSVGAEHRGGGGASAEWTLRRVA